MPLNTGSTLRQLPQQAQQEIQATGGNRFLAGMDVERSIKERNGGLDPRNKIDLNVIANIMQRKQSGQLPQDEEQALIALNPKISGILQNTELSQAVQVAREFTTPGREAMPAKPAVPFEDEAGAAFGVAQPGLIAQEAQPAQPAVPEQFNVEGAATRAETLGNFKLAREIRAARAPAGATAAPKFVRTRDAQGNNVTLMIDAEGNTVGQWQAEGRMPTDSAIKRMQAQGETFDDFDALSSGFKDQFGGFGSDTVGQAAISYRKRFGDDVDFVEFWQSYQDQVNALRNRLFGSALTEPEKREFNKAIITPGMSAISIRANLKRQRAMALRAAAKLARVYGTGNFDRRIVQEALGPHADEILNAPIPTARKRLERAREERAKTKQRQTRPTQRRRGGKPQQLDDILFGPD